MRESDKESDKESDRERERERGGGSCSTKQHLLQWSFKNFKIATNLGSADLAAEDDGLSRVGEDRLRRVDTGGVAGGLDLGWKNYVVVGGRGILAQGHADDGRHVDLRSVDFDRKSGCLAQIFHQPFKKRER